MRFMIIRKGDQDTEAGKMPSRQLMTDMQKYMADLAKAGVLLDADGLQPTSKGARIKFHNGHPTVTDGPFAEAKEVVGGYAMVQVRSKAEALEWAKRWPPLDGNGSVELELRQVFEPADFGPEFAPELQAHEAQIRASIGQK